MFKKLKEGHDDQSAVSEYKLAWDEIKEVGMVGPYWVDWTVF